MAVSEHDNVVKHPLDHITRGSWAKGVLRLLIAVLLLWVLTCLTGREAWDRLLKMENLPPIILGAVIAGTERVLRIRKWAWLLKDFPVRQPGWTYLLRIQFIGLFANLMIPCSELLKVWAISRNRKEVIPATESIILDVALSGGMVGFLALIACVPLLADRAWLLVPGTVFVVVAGLVIVLIRVRARRKRLNPVRLHTMIWLLSGLEALCIIAVHVVALRAIGVAMPLNLLVAAYPLLHLVVLVVLTPSSLGLRASLFTLVFAGVSNTPTDVAVAMGLMVSTMLTLVSVLGGSVALLLPQRAQKL